MAEQTTNALVTPSGTIADEVTANSTTAFDITWAEPDPPTSATFPLTFKGDAADGSDDAIFAVTAITGAAVTNGTWIKVGNQTVFPVGTEIDLSFTNEALRAVIAELVATHDAASTAHAGRLPKKVFPTSFILDVRTATTGNITLSGEQTVNNVAVVAGDLVLVWQQTNPIQNGLYEVSAGAWTRYSGFLPEGAPDADTELNRLIAMALEGASYTGNPIANADIEVAEIDTDAVEFALVDTAEFAVDLRAIAGANGISAKYVSAEVFADLEGFLALSAAGLEGYAGMTIAASNGTIYLNGPLQYKSVTKTANYTVTAADYAVDYTTLAAARTVTLPALSACADGQEFLITDATTGTHADTNNITIQRAGSDLFVGGGTNTIINTANGYRRIRKVNSRWQVVGSG